MLTFVASLILFQAATPAKPVYVQSLTKPDGKLEIMTAAQKFVREGKPDIWLVGAIHIGTKAYYTSVQELLNAQEAVFYEGVRPATPPKPVATPVPTDAPKPIYKVLSDALGLEFQLTNIDYGREGWRNVDLTWEELDKINKEVGGGKPTQFDQVRTMLDPKSPAAGMLATMLSTATPGMKEAIKIMIVRAATGQSNVALSPATEKVILEARNKAVVDELGKTVDAADAPKSIAVFYGALHMGEMQTALVDKLGYKPTDQKWFVAAEADPSKLDASGKALLDTFTKKN